MNRLSRRRVGQGLVLVLAVLAAGLSIAVAIIQEGEAAYVILATIFTALAVRELVVAARRSRV